MKEKIKKLNLHTLIVIISTAASELILLILVSEGEMQMETGSIIALVVALLGVASGIWTQVVQFRKDSRRIEENTASVGKVKEDTMYIKPKTDTIDENVKRIRDNVVEKITPSLSKLDGVDTLVSAYKVDKEIRERNSAALTNYTVLEGAIKSVYEKNAQLETLCKELQQENLFLKNRIYTLENSIGKEDAVHNERNLKL